VFFFFSFSFLKSFLLPRDGGSGSSTHKHTTRVGRNERRDESLFSRHCFYFLVLVLAHPSSPHEMICTPLDMTSHLHTLLSNSANLFPSFLPFDLFVRQPGELVIIPIQGRDLPNRERFGKQDPFILFKLGNVAKRSTTDVRGGQRPRWKDDQVWRMNTC